MPVIRVPNSTPIVNKPVNTTVSGTKITTGNVASGGLASNTKSGPPKITVPAPVASNGQNPPKGGQGTGTTVVSNQTTKINGQTGTITTGNGSNSTNKGGNSNNNGGNKNNNGGNKNVNGGGNNNPKGTTVVVLIPKGLLGGFGVLFTSPGNGGGVVTTGGIGVGDGGIPVPDSDPPLPLVDSIPSGTDDQNPSVEDPAPTGTTAVQILDLAADGPALQAGLAKDDVILKVDGKRVKSVEDLCAILALSSGKSKFLFYRPNADRLFKLQVSVVDGKIGVTVDEIRVDFDDSVDVDDTMIPSPDQAGTTVAAASAGNTTALQITDLDPGPAVDAGMAKGDIIVKVNQQRVTSYEDLRAILSPISGQVEFLVFRPSDGSLTNRLVTPVETRIGVSVEKVPVDLDEAQDGRSNTAATTQSTTGGQRSALQVTQVGRTGAGRAGIQTGDIILGVDGKWMADEAALVAALKSSSGESSIMLFLPDEGKVETKKVKVQDGSIGVAVKPVQVAAQ
jgi:S1-C subfamily serine protease